MERSIATLGFAGDAILSDSATLRERLRNRSEGIVDFTREHSGLQDAGKRLDGRGRHDDLDRTGRQGIDA